MPLFLFLLCALLAACSPTQAPPSESRPPSPAVPAPQAAPTEPSTATATATPTPPKESPILESRVRRIRSGGISMVLFVCDDRRVQFSVADQAKGPGSQWKNAQTVAQTTSAIAAINGGFFTPEGSPLGLVIENRNSFGHWNRSSSLTSGVFAVQNGTPLLTRRTSHDQSEHLLQTGPFLIENKSVISGLSNKNPRPRSFLLWNGRHHWALAYAKSSTLAALAQALASQPVSAFDIKFALNLDGGSSSQLWIGPMTKGGAQLHRPLWTKPVRNFILVHERP